MKKLLSLLTILLSGMIMLNSCSESRYALHEVKTGNKYVAVAPQARNPEVAAPAEPEMAARANELAADQEKTQLPAQLNSTSSSAKASVQSKTLAAAKKETKQIRQQIRELKRTNLAEVKKTDMDGELRKAVLVICLGIIICIFASIVGFVLGGTLGWLIYVIGAIVFLVGCVLLVLYLIDNL